MLLNSPWGSPWEFDTEMARRFCPFEKTWCFRGVREHCLGVQEERMSIQKETLDVLDISSAMVT